MRNFWQTFWRNRRVVVYLKWLEGHPLESTDNGIVNKLQVLWHEITPQDLLLIPVSIKATTSLSMWCLHLPTLVESLQIVNQHIQDKTDLQLESFLYGFQVKQETTLDFYFADKDLYPIDEKEYLIRLKGAILHHHYLLSKETNLYYQRLTTKLYQDIITLTVQLIKLNQKR